MGVVSRLGKGEDIWVGMWPLTLRQTRKRKFEKRNPTYINALKNKSEKSFVYYRKPLKEVPKALAEAVSELW